MALIISRGGGSSSAIAHSHFTTESAAVNVRGFAALRTSEEIAALKFGAGTPAPFYDGTVDGMKILLDPDSSTMQWGAKKGFVLIEPPDDIWVQYESFVSQLLLDENWNANIGTNTCKIFRINDTTESFSDGINSEDRFMDQRLNDEREGLFYLEGYLSSGPIRVDLGGGDFDNQPGGDTTEGRYQNQINQGGDGFASFAKEEVFYYDGDIWTLFTLQFRQADRTMLAWAKDSTMAAAVQTHEYDLSTWYTNGFYADELEPLIHFTGDDPPPRGHPQMPVGYRNLIASTSPINANPSWDSGTGTWVV